MSGLQPLQYVQPAFSRIVGTGGIGTGMFFLLEDEHTIGRNESRMGKLAPVKDYCKLHIVMHYLAVFLGPGLEISPIGQVGDDESGQRMLREMEQVGMNMKHVLVTQKAATLFAVCFQYPDSSGGNMTASNSASSQVAPEQIDEYFRNSGHRHGTRGLALALPEVPLPARIRLLQQARASGYYTVASVLPAEAAAFAEMGGFGLTDLLAVNREEAGAIAGITDPDIGSERLAIACIDKLKGSYRDLSLCITDGSSGSYGYAEGRMERVPPLPAKAVATGGAGDAFLSGVIAGLCCGLPLLKGRTDTCFSETPLQSAMELGTLLASLSVTSPDTIHPTADAQLLHNYAVSRNVTCSPNFARLFRFA